MIEKVTSEEQWLYGENQDSLIENDDSLRPPGVDDDLAYGKENNGDKNNNDNDSDYDDDDLNIVIGSMNTTTTVFESLNIKRRQLPSIVNAAEKLKQVTRKFAVEDFESAGVINNIPLADYSLDAVEDKPWRKPGADISDYFNYGFNEETWNSYCERQKRIRSQVGVAPTNGLPLLGNMPEHSALLAPVASVAGPLPTFDVLGNEKANFVPSIISGAFPLFDNEFFNPEPTQFYDGFVQTQTVQWKPDKIQVQNLSNINPYGQQHIRANIHSRRSMSKRYSQSKSRSRSPYRYNDRSLRSDRSDRHTDRHKRERSRSRTHRHRSSRSRSGSRHRSSHKKKKSRHHHKEDSPVNTKRIIRS